MQNGVEEQIRFLLGVVLSGIGCGLIYDIIRARRKLFNWGNICVNIEDIIFCLFTAVVFLTVTFYLNSGVVRVSGFFGILFGELMYFLIIRNRIRNFFVFAAKKLYWGFNKILKILFFPLKLIVHIIIKPVHIVAWYAGGRIRKLKYKARLILSKIKNHLKIINLFVVKRAKKH